MFMQTLQYSDEQGDEFAVCKSISTNTFCVVSQFLLEKRLIVFFLTSEGLTRQFLSPSGFSRQN